MGLSQAHGRPSVLTTPTRKIFCISGQNFPCCMLWTKTLILFFFPSPVPWEHSNCVFPKTALSVTKESGSITHHLPSYVSRQICPSIHRKYWVEWNSNVCAYSSPVLEHYFIFQQQKSFKQEGYSQMLVQTMAWRARNCGHKDSQSGSCIHSPHQRETWKKILIFCLWCW